jgi:hypothetical protein
MTDDAMTFDQEKRRLGDATPRVIMVQLVRRTVASRCFTRAADLRAAN